MKDLDDIIQTLISEAFKTGPLGRARSSEVRQAIVRNLHSIKAMQERGFGNAAIARVLGDVSPTSKHAGKPWIGYRWETIVKYIDEYAPVAKKIKRIGSNRAKRVATIPDPRLPSCRLDASISPSGPADSGRSTVLFGSGHSMTYVQ